MNRRILFTDLDGTLLNDQKEITPGNQAAVDKALAQGHIIVIATGRPLASARIQACRLGLTKEGCYIISFNGAQIFDSHCEKTIYSKALPQSIIGPLFQAAHQYGLHIQAYNDTHILSEYETPALKKSAAINGIPYEIVDNISSALTEPTHKLITIDLFNHRKLLLFQEEILSKYEDSLQSFFSNDMFLEIVPVGITKGFAVQWLCSYLGIPLENSVAAGDAQNDISMLEAAHIGAVMCNAFPGVREYGNYITQADNNHDGIAEIIHRFIL